MIKHYWYLSHTTKFVIIPMRTNGLTAQRNPQPRKNKTQREAKHNKTKTNWKTNIRESLVIRSKIGDTGEIQCRRYEMYIERGAGGVGANLLWSFSVEVEVEEEEDEALVEISGTFSMCAALATNFRMHYFLAVGTFV